MITAPIESFAVAVYTIPTDAPEADGILTWTDVSRCGGITEWLRVAAVAAAHHLEISGHTLEDILEQIVGDIRDEHDSVREHLVERLPDGSVRMMGRAQLAVVRRELGIDLEEHREATFGGYLIEMSGRVPESGEALNLGHLADCYRGWPPSASRMSRASTRGQLAAQDEDRV